VLRTPAPLIGALGGTPVEALYAGLQPTFVGLDQINVRLLRSLAGRGEVEVVVEVDGKPANPVHMNINSGVPIARTDARRSN
jgi:uncharacterized protein (TIGR03437 family)